MSRQDFLLLKVDNTPDIQVNFFIYSLNNILTRLFLRPHCHLQLKINTVG